MRKIALFVGILFQLSILSSAESNGFSIDLIHIDSPLSPFYNSSMTQSDVLINAAFDSISRAESFPLNTSLNRDETITIPNKGTYLMAFFIGTFPRGLLAVADTGSDLTWIQCSPCTKCYKQRLPIFDPRNSYTFHLIPCGNSFCKKVRRNSCGFVGECRYEVDYASKSSTQGVVATDTISFNNSYDGRTIKYPNTIFGCGYNNTGVFKPTSAGIFGLGGGPSSFISQHGAEFGKRKFSYCLLPFYYVQGSSKLKFGVDTQKNRTGVVTTPLVSLNPSTYYYLSLDSVSINGKMVRPNESTFGNIIIDSGATVTFLKTSWYEKVEAAVLEVIGHQSVAVRYPIRPFRLCYKDGSITNFPSIGLQFYGSFKELKLSTLNTFVTLGNLTCFAILPTEKISIIGNLLQVFFNIEYDLEERTVSFVKANCLKE
ncbi:PREDICTED: probable aspartic protease At2g35615 [Lupinus angustifolius]|uniref:probable aspartic protease At2g35615 n=1 Tax=Lupinus angustifolius TaxID=3871 RepID=UPI00092ECC0F|nr:PREDICTED: probable aspartic protease At2g35615 [Lupinus angustifolius]